MRSWGFAPGSDKSAPLALRTGRKERPLERELELDLGVGHGGAVFDPDAADHDHRQAEKDQEVAGEASPPRDSHRSVLTTIALP